MKSIKSILLLILLSLIFGNMQSLFAQDNSPAPYTKEEFPQSLQDLRRFEIVSLGAMPFVTLDVTLAYSGIRWVQNDFSSQYKPTIFGASSFDKDEQQKIILYSLGVSLGVGLTDLIVRVAKRSYTEKKENQKIKNIVVTPIDEDPTAVKLNNPYKEEEQ